MRLLIRWGINTVVILALGYLLPDKMLSIGSITVAIAVALVLGLLNTFARTAFVKLALPLAPWTLGLFVFVVNSVVVRLFAWLVGENYVLGGFLWLLVIAVIFSVVTTVVNIAVGGDPQPAPARRRESDRERTR